MGVAASSGSSVPIGNYTLSVFHSHYFDTMLFVTCTDIKRSSRTHTQNHHDHVTYIEIFGDLNGFLVKINLQGFPG
jgi:hypothetical protein